MVRYVRWPLIGTALALVGVLAACGSKFGAEREPWRHEAEVTCLNSGAVKEGTGKVRIQAINGPGMCGADFPIKVSALGDSAPLGYDELRPPAGIPGAALPRWPVTQPPQAYEASPGPRDASRAGRDQPVSLDPRGAANAGAAEPYDFRRPYVASPSPAYDLSPEPYDRRRIIEEPWTRRSDPPSAPRRAAAREAPSPVLGSRPVLGPRPVLGLRPVLGPSRGPVAPAAGPVSVSPAATLACPLVSVLDQWIAASVQPAALRWFGQPVVEIKQISAYSCRGMNGNPNARISEHAFGNALDIASFTLADGRKVTVKNGWNGAPEEQGFLRDVQATACDQFNTVLAPGSNVHHYDHIHVDLMRRGNGHRACNPHAVSGEEVAARAGARFAAKRGGEPLVTGSVTPRRLPSPAKRISSAAYPDGMPTRKLPAAVAGADGED